MDNLLNAAQRPLLLTGRALLGLYFILPGISKITSWGATATYMAAHGVPLIPVLLALTIVLQIGGGLSLLLGYRAALVALVLAGLTVVISIYMHDFWNVAEDALRAHEMQNFIKNMAIAAGLLCVAGLTPTAPAQSAAARTG